MSAQRRLRRSICRAQGLPLDWARVAPTQRPVKKRRRRRAARYVSRRLYSLSGGAR